jgi:hypothetical protein
VATKVTLNDLPESDVLVLVEIMGAVLSQTSMSARAKGEDPLMFLV